jgi:hypothetical protein
MPVRPTEFPTESLLEGGVDVKHSAAGKYATMMATGRSIFIFNLLPSIFYLLPYFAEDSTTKEGDREGGEMSESEMSDDSEEKRRREREERLPEDFFH